MNCGYTMQASGRIEGLELLDARLAQLKADAQGKAAKFAMLKAAQLVRNAAIQNAAGVNDPATPEEIARNVTVRFSSKVYKQSGLIHYRVGIMGGAKVPREKNTGPTGPGGRTFYWRFLEFGTAKMAPKPFLRAALISNIDTATAEFVKHYGKAIDRAIKKQGRT